MNRIDVQLAAWLDRLAAALAADDPAVRHDALSQARERLLAALASIGPDADDRAVTSLLADYGDPVEVARSYRMAERRSHGNDQRSAQITLPATLQGSTAAPTLPPAPWFGVVRDSGAWSALAYMLLALPLGIAWFTWTLLGGTVSGALLLLIIGVPLALGYLASIRGMALADGRIVEALLGERMPRRPWPTYADESRLGRLRRQLGTRRTWTSIGYLIAMLPLGAAYCLLAAVGLCVGVALALAPGLLAGVAAHGDLGLTGRVLVLSLVLMPAGVCLLLATLHAARGVGALHGQFAKAMLVGGEGVAIRRRPVAPASSLGRALALGAIALVVGGAAAFKAADMHRSQISAHTERVVASDVQFVDVDIDNANVRFVPDSSISSGEVRVESHVTTFHEEQREQPAVTLETDGERAVLSAACGDELVLLPGDCLADIVVHVPSDHSIAVLGRTDNGDVELSAGLGQIDLRTDNGRIGGLVDATTVSVSSDNGDVMLRLAHSVEDVTIQTENGDVELVAPGSWQVQVRTDNGDQQVSVPSTAGAPRAIHVRTDNGDVEVHG